MSERVDRVIRVLLRLTATELAELKSRGIIPPKPEAPPDAGVREPRRPLPTGGEAAATKEFE